QSQNAMASEKWPRPTRDPRDSAADGFSPEDTGRTAGAARRVRPGTPADISGVQPADRRYPNGSADGGRRPRPTGDLRYGPNVDEPRYGGPGPGGWREGPDPRMTRDPRSAPGPGNPMAPPRPPPGLDGAPPAAPPSRGTGTP